MFWETDPCVSDRESTSHEQLQCERIMHKTSLHGTGHTNMRQFDDSTSETVKKAAMVRLILTKND